MIFAESREFLLFSPWFFKFEHWTSYNELQTRKWYGDGTYGNPAFSNFRIFLPFILNPRGGGTGRMGAFGLLFPSPPSGMWPPYLRPQVWEGIGPDLILFGGQRGDLDYSKTGKTSVAPICLGLPPSGLTFIGALKGLCQLFLEHLKKSQVTFPLMKTWK